jgi:hypothetical protein
MCKPCAEPSKTVVDRDSRAGKFYLSFSWGDLMTSAGSQVSAVTAYHVVIADLQGRIVTSKGTNGVVGTVPANANPPSCCNPNAYTFKMQGETTQLDISMYRAAIRPAAGNVMLPFVYISDQMSDTAVGQVKTFTGDVKLTMSMANIDALASNPKAKMMLAKSLAQTIGFDADEVIVTAVWKRLVGSTGAWTEIMSSSRRLGGHTGAYEMKIDYEVITTDTTKTLVAADFVPAQLIANVQAEAAAIGTPVTITAAEASAPTGTIVGTPTGTTGSSSGLFFHLLAAMLAVGTHLML